MCQRYDQDTAKKDKASFRDDTSILRSWLPETRDVLNSWCMVNVGIQDVQKLLRESWISSFKKFNLHPKHRVSFIQWCDRIKPFLQVRDYFKPDTKLTIHDEYDLLSLFWKEIQPAEKKALVEAFGSHSVWDFPCIWKVQRRFHIDTKELQNFCVCVNLALYKPEHLELVSQYKQRPTYDIYTADVCDNNHKYINEGLHSLYIFPKKDGELILNGYQLLKHMIWFSQINVCTNSDAYISLLSTFRFHRINSIFTQSTC